MKYLLSLIVILSLAGALSGCQTSRTDPDTLDLTLNRGAQLLAAGSPKSAIPFLTQTIASTPDGPEPVALLALAFALDLQSEQALLQAQKVHRGAKEAPGWELVAVGIAQTVLNRPDEAIASFQRVLAGASAESPLASATRQWLALAQVIKGDDPAALATLNNLVKCPPMKSSALLWTLLICARDGQTQLGANALAQCAAEVAATFGKPSFEGKLDDQTLYDSAIAAIAEGKFDNARQIFLLLQKRDTNGGDASLWLALISAAQGQWQAARETLADAGETAPLPARGLANQLLTVVRALEGRPESMIQHMLAGQRMMGHDTTPAHILESPKPESVWFSDSLK